MQSKKIFYGWVNVIACSLVLAIGMGVLSNAAGVFIKPVCDSLRFARGDFSLHRTILTLVGVFCLPFFTRLIPKYGVKKTMLVCGCALSLITFAFAFCTQIWHFYVLAVLYGIFTNGVSFFLIGTLINYWFDDNKGLATGIAYCGSNIGGALAIVVLGNLIERIGWQWAYAASGLLGLLLLIPIILLFIREKPQDMGLQPYRRSATAVIQTDAPTIQHSGMLLSQARRTSLFWILLIAFFFFSLCCGGPSSHLNAFLTDNGYSIALATAIHSFLQISVACTKIAIGAFIDKAGIAAGGIFLGICCIATPALALIIRSPIAAWLHALLLGVICAGYSIAISIYVSKLFGNLDFSAILGVFSMDTALAGAISSPFMGSVFDHTGSYRLSWVILLVCGILAACGLSIVNLLQRRHRSES